MPHFEWIWERRNRLPILLASGVLVLAIAGLDWRTKPYFSLGFLYLFPIMLAAGFLPRWAIVLAGIACALLSERFSNLDPADAHIRFGFEALALCGCGLLTAEVLRNRRLSMEAQERIRVLVGIIDGLGHGQFAHRAAQTARHYVENHFDLSLGQIFCGVNRACRATRGLVMALACFDWGQGRLTFASVGNIEVRVFPSSKSFHFLVRRGILGLNAPQAVVAEHPWPLENVMVLHSDGLSTHWGWKDFPDLADKPASVAAQTLLRALAKDQDDATVIVVRKIDP